MRTVVAIAALSLAACGPKIEKVPGKQIILSDYNLVIHPKVPGNQTMFTGANVIKLVFRQPGGEDEIVSLGSADQPEATADKLPALENTRIGVLIENAGANDDEYDPDKLVAYGEVGPFTLGTEGDKVDADVMLALTDGVATLGKLDRPRIGAAVAILPNGDSFVFGGHDPRSAIDCTPSPGDTDTDTNPATDTDTNPATDTDTDTAPTDTAPPLPTDPVQVRCYPGTRDILRMSNLNQGSWTFETLGEKMPAPLVRATATVVFDKGDNPLILVAGGRPDMRHLDDNRNTAFLFDPAKNAIVWEGKMTARRSEHQAVRMVGGNVAIIGGVTSATDGGPGEFQGDASWELFNPSTKKFKSGTNLTGVPQIGFAASEVTDGAIACGGATWVTSPRDRTEPSRICYALGTEGSAGTIATMGSPGRYTHGIGPLANGQAIACGGLTVDLDPDEIDAAETGCEVLSNGIWFDTNPMLTARAYPTAVPSPDDTVWFVGGAAQGGWPLVGDAGALQPERFNFSQNSWSSASSNSPAATGALVAASWDDNGGVFLLEGYTQDSTTGDYVGGSTYGYIAYPPQGL